MGRGRLRIYLGAAPGVGKTVAMLDEAHRRLERGTDVVVGLVETHGRPHTAQLLDGLEVLPRRVVTHRGATVDEMDLDAVLTRRPAVALVDELAHTNAPGSRHEKRGRTSTSCSTQGSTSSRPSTSSTWSRSTMPSSRSRGSSSARRCPTRSSAGPSRSSWSTCRPRRCGDGWPTATCTAPRRSTPPSPTTSGSATSPPCASSRCSGWPTGSTRGWGATGPTTASRAPGPPGSGSWSHCPGVPRGRRCCAAGPGSRPAGPAANCSPCTCRAPTDSPGRTFPGWPSSGGSPTSSVAASTP